jgi:hypothetical protein
MAFPHTTSGPAAQVGLTAQEAVMGKAIPTQHPAVVLRSQFNVVQALLALAMIAVIGLSAAVVIVANDDESAGTSSASQIESIDYGGFNPATGRPLAAPLPQSEAQAPAGTTRYDGGPEEGSRGMSAKDYGQNSATGEVAPVPAQPDTPRFGGGAEESQRGPGFSTD